MGGTLLLIDAGNSRLKWSRAESGRLLESGAVEHGGDPAAAFATIEPGVVEQVWIADVTGGALREGLAAAVQGCCGVVPRFAVSESHRAGLTNAYATPQRMGVDRWLMLLAAWSGSAAPACVVSAGTALTFDAVDARGRHLGGVIAPGLLAMQQAVLGSTRFDAAGPREDYAAGLGDDTEACVRQGAVHAAAGLIDRLAAQSDDAAGRWLCGGDAATLLPLLRTGWMLRPDLVLEGLLALATDDARS